MLVACRLAGLSALEGQYDRVDERVQICRRGPSAPQAREPSLFAPRHWPRWIASPWPRRGTPGLPRPGPAPHSQCCSQGWTVVDIWLARLG